MHIVRRENLREGHLGKKDKSLLPGPIRGRRQFFFKCESPPLLKLELKFGAGSLVAAKKTPMFKSFSPQSNLSQSPGDLELREAPGQGN